MDILACTFKAIVGYFIFMIVGTNLLGLIVRGFVPYYIKDEHGDLVIAENKTSSKGIVLTLFFVILTIFYLIVIYRYCNLGVVLSAAILMIVRLPDLLFEMRTGEKLTAKNMPKRPIDLFCMVLGWAALPILWYSLYCEIR